MQHSKAAGISAAEYGILGGLVVVVSIAGLSLLGNSTAHMVNTTSSGHNRNAMEQMATLNFGSGSMASSGRTGGQSGGNGTIDVNGVSHGGVNVSSTEGSRMPPAINTALRTAQAFEEMAKEPENTEISQLLKDIANDAYLLAS